MNVNIKWKAPSTIAFLCFLGITIICFCLMNTASAFSIIGSISLTCAAAIITWKSFLNYQIFKRRLADKKLEDAYLYAEQLGDEEAIKNFEYDSKTRRRIRYEKFNRFLLPFSCFAILLCGIFLFLICTKIL